jgi:DNA-binding response OmpR family regulator
VSPEKQPRKVLVVDDDQVIRVLLEERLAAWGYETVLCADGEEGWEAFLATPAVRHAIIDWIMPNVDGLELIRRIRDHEREQERPATYVILLTSQSGREKVITGLQAGADDYLVKDDNFQSMVQARLQVADKQIEFEELLAQAKEPVGESK